MARDGITFEQVAATADALMGQGQQPTIRAIRDALGTGSPNTVHRHLAAWREARPPAVTAASRLSANLTAAIAVEIERAAAQARAEIETRLAQAQTEAADLAVAGEALEAEMAELVGRVAALTSERDTVAGKAAQQAADLSVHAQRIEREQAAAEAARVETATARIKIEMLAEQLTGKTAELTHVRVTLDASQKSHQQAEQQAAVLVAKLEAATARGREIETRAAKAEQQAQATARELANANAVAQAERTRLESATRELDDARKAAADAHAASSKLGEEAAELRGRLAKTTKAKASGAH